MTPCNVIQYNYYSACNVKWVKIPKNNDVSGKRLKQLIS